jgi:WD40 repeat protein
VYSVAFSPDGAHIVSGSYDKTLRVWDAQTGKELAVLKGHSSYVYSVAFSPDGAHIVSGSHDKTVRVWDAQTGKDRGVASEQGSDSIPPRVVVGKTPLTSFSSRLWRCGKSVVAFPIWNLWHKHL